MTRTQRLTAFGASVRAIRVSIGASQSTIGARIGRSQGFVSLVEHGKVHGLSVAESDALCEALGATLVFGVEAPLLMEAGRQRDAAHARCTAFVTRRLRAAGWLVAREVEIGVPRRPGWIDILAFDPVTRTLLVIEVKTQILDVGGLERQIRWYEREAPAAARRLGWRSSRVICAALVLATTVNDERLRENAAGVAQLFPLRARRVMGIIDGALDGALDVDGGWALAMIDPRSRARRWCRPTILDGRSSAGPYRHVADFLRATTRGAHRH